MTNDEKRILEMLEEMNQVAQLAIRVKKIAQEIDDTALYASQKTFEMATIRSQNGDEMEFSSAIHIVKEAAFKVSGQLNRLIDEVSGLYKTNNTDDKIRRHQKEI